MSPAHGVYWPIMLHALDFEDTEISPLLVHGFWNMGGAKMSKCVGNSADPAALAAVFDLASHCNQFIENEKPCTLAKDPEQAARLDAVLYHLADSLRILSILLSPVLPRAARGIAAQLNWDQPFALADAKWGG